MSPASAAADALAEQEAPTKAAACAPAPTACGLPDAGPALGGAQLSWGYFTKPGAMTVQVGDWIAHKFHHPAPEWCAGLVLCEKKATKKKPAQWLVRYDTPYDRLEKEKEKKLKPNSVKSAVVDMGQNLRMEDYGDTAVWVFLHPEHQ